MSDVRGQSLEIRYQRRMYIDQKGESREDSAIQYIRHNRKKRERIKLKAKIIIGKDEGGNQRHESISGRYQSRKS